MSKVKKESFFWASYSDLMTSLFFVMLVLFVSTVVMLHKRAVMVQEQIDKIKEIEQATKDIDPKYFIYSEKYKKHILNINVNFPIGVSSMNSIDAITRRQLIEAGKSIQRLIQEKTKEYGIQYLLVIEGQASKDNYTRNYELSYERALSLSNFWMEQGLDFGNDCELLISGTGTGGIMRDPKERNNQRFLIHIIPKPGIIEAGEKH
jgi:hypothetical protein